MGTFVKVWLAVTVAMAALVFVVPFLVVPAVLVINVVAYVFGSKGITLSIYNLWNFALPFSAMVGLFALTLTVPVMVLKELSGDLSRSTNALTQSSPALAIYIQTIV